MEVEVFLLFGAERGFGQALAGGGFERAEDVLVSGVGGGEFADDGGRGPGGGSEAGWPGSASWASWVMASR